MSGNKFGIYVHIPFCKKACHYCGFHFSTNITLKKKVVDAIIKELYIKSTLYPDIIISTIYFGGGTPSILNIEELESIKNAICLNFTIENGNIEQTIEINPDDVSEEKLKNFKKIGFNRLSIGMQTFNDDVLKFINRSHDSKTALDVMNLARKLEFDNINVDIIFALPNSNIKILEEDLKIIKKISPEHLSIYCLNIEEKTLFKNWLDRGIINEASETRILEEYNLICMKMKEMDYTHYEVSNFAKKEFFSRHNSSYWNQQKGYIGVGPSAHSYDFISRKSNIANNFKYVEAINQNIIPETTEHLSEKQKANEYIMTSIRTINGCDLIYLKKNFEYDILNKELLYADFISKGYLIRRENTLLPTESGMLIADEIAKKMWWD